MCISLTDAMEHVGLMAKFCCVLEKLKACCSMAETYLEDIKIDRPVTDDAFDTADLQDKMSTYRACVCAYVDDRLNSG